MNLIGTLKIGQAVHFIYVSDVKSSMTYMVLDKYHSEDARAVILGEETQHVVLKSVQAAESYATTDYVIEGLSRTKVSGKVKIYRNHNVIDKLMDTLSFASMYSFRKDNIAIDSTFCANEEVQRIFKAEDHNLYYEIKTVDNLYNSILIDDKTANVTVELQKTKLSLKAKDLDFVETDNTTRKKILISSLKSVTYEMLCEALDMSWFEENGVRKKEYKAITTIKEFEELIVTPLLKSIMYHENSGTEILVGLDTETTGLNICDLSPTNPARDHCVAIPIAWEDDKAFVIFTDMEHFNSISTEYVVKRLEPLFAKKEFTYDRNGNKVEKTIAYQSYKVVSKTAEKEEQPALQNMELFGSSVEDATSSDENKDNPDMYTLEKDEVFQFHRSTINLTGHNVIFDGKVFINEGIRVYFNNDTLQMAFDLNPKSVRGSNKLKTLTRKFFGHETPELEDILGKNNEDKYRYLTDPLVATIYGCADADYSRLLFKELRKLMTDEMYRQYQTLDVPLFYKLSDAEYRGLNTVSDKVTNLAQRSQEDLEILKNFMYDYVGKVVYIEKQRGMVEEKFKIGVYKSEEEKQKALEEALKNIPSDTRFEFELKAADIRDVIYKILGYPVYAYTKGDAFGNNKKPKTDKFVMKKLMSQKRNGNQGAIDSGWCLNKHVLSSAITQEDYDSLIEAGKKKEAEAYVLVDKDQFNECQYPIAVVLSKYAELNKEYTSYFKPILEENLEGKIFKGFSMARIETRRIMNPGQTMKANLKAMIRSYQAYPGDESYYALGFDMSQAEYRIMASLAGHTEIINKMKDPEKDYHIETAALVYGIPAYKVSKKLRKQTKCIGFGVPYGLSIPSLAETLFGAKNDDTIFETTMLLKKWYKSNQPIVDWLDEQRDKALTQQYITDAMRDFMDAWERDTIRDAKGTIISNEYKLDANGNKIPKPIGFAKNEKGFYRTFDLANLDNKKISTIRRMAGNYPIQSFAAELFRTILIRFSNACEKYGVQDKVVWHMLIHDELFCSVHKSVHPFLMYKIIKEACMITLPGHTNYFVGINIGTSWGQTHDDALEAPVYFVNRIIKRYDAGEFKETWIDDPGSYVLKYKAEYVRDRIGEVLRKVQPDIDTGVINIPYILEHFDNYTVRAYVDDYDMYHAVKKPSKKELEDQEIKDHYDNECWVSRLESWIMEVYGEGRTLISQDGVKYQLNADTYNNASEDIVVDDLLDDLTEDIVSDKEESESMLFEVEDYWSFDETGFESSYGGTVYVEDDEEDFTKQYTIDTNNVMAVNLAQLIEDKPKYKNLLLTKNQLIIKVNNKKEVENCKAYLKSFVSTTGLSVMFNTPLHNIRWLKIKDNTDLSELDNLIEKGR